MIRWITENLGTAAWDRVDRSSEFSLLDVRDLIDGPGNSPSAVRAKIDEAFEYLNQGKKVVICCEKGMSRSNAIAAGALAVYRATTLQEAIERVLSATGETAIRIEVLATVRQALGETSSGTGSGQSSRPRILLTGGSGFVGRALTEELSSKYQVFAPRRQDIDLTKDAVRLDLLVNGQGIDTVVHLANPRICTNSAALGEALTMFQNVLDVCVNNRLFLVHLSCWQIYSGYKTEEINADESLSACPGDTNGLIKFLCEVMLDQYYRRGGLDYVLLRSSALFGSGSDRPAFLRTFIQKAMCNEPIQVHKFLNGFPKLDLLHITDLTAAVVAAIERRTHDTIHLGTGVGTPIVEIALHIIGQLNSRSEISYLNCNGYTSNVTMNHARARTILRWDPKIPLRVGLESVIEWACVKGLA